MPDEDFLPLMIAMVMLIAALVAVLSNPHAMQTVHDALVGTQANTAPATWL